MKKYFLSALLLFSITTSNASQGDLIEVILGQPKPMGGRSTVVFDIDETLCVFGDGIDENQSKVFERFPESLMVPFQDAKGEKSKFIFFPDIIEVFLSCLQAGQNVYIFSAGPQERNVSIIKYFAEHMLAKYTDQPEEAFAALLESRIKIFSREDLALRSDNANDVALYERWGRSSKDLRKMGLDPCSSILVDDNRTYAVGGEQYPYLDSYLPLGQGPYYNGLNKRGLISHDRVASGREDKITACPFEDQACFYAGVLGASQDIMGFGVPLREALKIVLERDGYVPPEDQEKLDYYHKRKCDTPWYLSGSGELPMEKYSAILSRGQLAIEEIKRWRLDFVAPEDPRADID